MDAREDWLQTLKQGQIIIECSATEHTVVQKKKKKKGKIWYHNVYTNVSNVRCVLIKDGFSSDRKRHIIPQDAEDPNNDPYTNLYNVP